MCYPKITIIVPLYNSATTIEMCVRSIQAQTLRDWQLILADNGSTDNSFGIITHLGQEDDRIQVISAVERGVASARNAALDIASGEHVCFVDSDDVVDPDYLKVLCSNMAADLTVCGYRVDYIANDGSVMRSDSRSPSVIKWQSPSSKAVLAETFESGYIHICCNKLFRRDIIEREHIRFRNFPVNEDYIFVMEYLKHAASMAVIENTPYHWRRPIGKATGVNSIPDNLLEIYNISHQLTRDFFHNNGIADRIAFFSYELLIFKYYDAIARKVLAKDTALNYANKLARNKLVNDAFKAYKPKSFAASLLHFIFYRKMIKIHYILSKKILH